MTFNIQHLCACPWCLPRQVFEGQDKQNMKRSGQNGATSWASLVVLLSILVVVSSRDALATVEVNAATVIGTSFEEDVIQSVASATLYENTNSSQEEHGQVVVKPVDLARQATIEGDEAQIVTIELEPGQSIRTRPGTMIYRTDSIQMKTHMPHGAMARFFSNTPLFLVDYTNTGKYRASLALGDRRPSKILDINMDDYGGQLTIRKGVFLVGYPNGLEMGIKRSSKSILAQFFGGQGFLLQTLRGRGNVLLRSGGVQIRKKLEKTNIFASTLTVL
jgi:uncharacterized protein (AIM24 family)